MKELHKHCYDLALLFIPPATSLDWPRTSEWLMIASGVSRVDVDLSRFDQSFGFCESADEYYTKRSGLLSGLATELTTFSFIWGALETVIKEVKPARIPRSFTREKPGDSLVLRACYTLLKEFEPDQLLAGYSHLIASLRQLLLAPGGAHYKNLASEFELKRVIGVSGIGLNVVRLIRNRFAHGVAGFPQPEGWSGEKPPDVEIIHVSSRIVLLSIQMLLVALHKREPIDLSMEEFDSEEGPIRNLSRRDTAMALFRTVHLLEEEDEDQLPL